MKTFLHKLLNKHNPSRCGLGLLLLAAFAVTMFGCTQGVSPKFETEGGSTGLELNFTAYNVPYLNFATEAGGFYADISDKKFPVDKNGLLTAPKNDRDFYIASKDPVLFIPHVTQNAGLNKVKTYNIGGFEYSAWLRLTDDTKTTANIRKESFNEPQGALLAVPFVDAKQNPLGSLFVAVFQDEPFPKEVPILGAGAGAIQLCNNGSAGNPHAGQGLCKNVALLMNLHEEKTERAYVIATARVPTIKAQSKSMVFNPQAGVSPQSREQLLKDNSFHKVTLQVGDDVPDKDLGDGSFHGPTLRVLVDNEEVIVYKNNGGITPSHVLKKGWWDSIRDAGLGGKHNLAMDVFKTTSNESGNTSPYVGFFQGDARTAPKSNGAKEYNQAWKNLVGKNGNMANMATFGIVFQLGATGKSGSATVNNTLSPQIASISIKKYHENSGVASTIAIDQTGPIEIAGSATSQLTATVSPTDKSFNRNLRWSSNNISIAWVDSQGVVHGGSTTGTATIKVTHIQSGLTATISVNVTKVDATSVSLNKSSLALGIGRSEQLRAVILPNNTNARKPTWKSSNDTVATVDAYGMVKGIAAGTATITATADGQKATADVTVANIPVSSLSLPSSREVIAHYRKTAKLIASVYPLDATNQSLTWKSTDEGIATVDSSGNVKGIKKGTTTITAETQDGSNLTKTSTVTVSVVDITLVAFDAGTSVNVGIAGTFNQVYKFTTIPTQASIKSFSCTRVGGSSYYNASNASNEEGCRVTGTRLAGQNSQIQVEVTDFNGNKKKATIWINSK